MELKYERKEELSGREVFIVLRNGIAIRGFFSDVDVNGVMRVVNTWFDNKPSGTTDLIDSVDVVDIKILQITEPVKLIQ